MTKAKTDSLVTRLLRGAVSYESDSGPVWAGPTALEHEAALAISSLIIDLEWIRAHYAGAPTKMVNERIDAAISNARGAAS